MMKLKHKSLIPGLALSALLAGCLDPAPLKGGGGGDSGDPIVAATVYPMVLSITRVDPTPSSAASVDFSVVFDRAVTGVDSGDFALVTDGTIAGASITSVTAASTSAYTVQVSTGTGSGQIRLTLVDDDSIVDSEGRLLGDTGAGNGDYDSGQIYAMDRAAPSVTGITRLQASQNGLSQVVYRVSFSEAVSGLDAGDFGVNVTGAIAGESIDSVSASSGSVFDVTVGTGSGNGTLRLDFYDDDSVVDAAGNPAGGAGAGNADHLTGPVYDIDKTLPSVSSIARVSAATLDAASVSYTVTFSEAVTGVNTGDFALTTTGGISGASVQSVTPVSGSVYTVAVNTGGGDGTVRLDLADNDSIRDSHGNALGGGGTGNGDFSAGEVYTVDKSAPRVSSIARAGANPSNAASVDYTVTFTEDVTGVNAADFSLSRNGPSTAFVSSITPVSASVYTVTVDTGTGDGTLTLSLVDDDSIADQVSHKLVSATSSDGGLTGEVYTINKSNPSVSSIARLDSNPTDASSVRFLVTFSESVSGVGTADFAITESGISGASVSSVTQNSGFQYTVDVDTTASGTGTIRLDVVDDDSIVDATSVALGGAGAGNGAYASGPSYSVDHDSPTIVDVIRDGSTPTNAASVTFTVIFTENVSGVGTADFSLSTTGVTGASITGVTAVTAANYTVTVNTGSGSGTIQLNVADDDTIVDIFNHPQAGAGTAAVRWAGPTYTIDKTGPAVVSMTMLDASPTNDSTVSYRVVFDEDATGVDAADFTVNQTGTIAGTSIGSVTAYTPINYVVVINTGAGDGDVGLEFVDDGTVLDSAGNPPGTPVAGDYTYQSASDYSLDRTALAITGISYTTGYEEVGRVSSVSLDVTGRETGASLAVYADNLCSPANQVGTSTNSDTVIATVSSSHTLYTLYVAQTDAVGNVSPCSAVSVPYTYIPYVSAREYFTSGDGLSGDLLGNSVAIDGQTIVAGAPQADVGANANQGAVYVRSYDPSTSAWEETKLTASDGAANDEFGASVAVSGRFIAVGANKHSSGRGAVYMYQLDPSTGAWTQVQKLSASDAAVNDYFGVSVALHGTRLVVGALYGDGGIANSGNAYVFGYDPSTGLWAQKQEIYASDPTGTDQYGGSVSVHGDYIAVGAPLKTTNRGGVYIYKWDPSALTWSQVQSFSAGTAQSMGISVSIRGSRLAVGAPGYTNYNTGGVYSYELDPSTGTWVQRQIIVGPAYTAITYFGWSVSVDGGSMLIGRKNRHQAYFYDWNPATRQWVQRTSITVNNNAGQAVALSGTHGVVGVPSYLASNQQGGFVYVQLDKGQGTEAERKLTASTPTDNGELGPVSATGGLVVMGEPGYNLGQGRAIVKHFYNDAWTETVLTASDGAIGDNFGAAVSVRGDVILIGAYGDDSEKGAAYLYVYDYDTSSWVEQKFVASDGAAGDRFGFSVSNSGFVLGIGAPNANGAQGKAYLNKLDPDSNPSAWNETILEASDGAVNDRFGYAVSVSGDAILVGAKGHSSITGAAYLYRFDPSDDSYPETKFMAGDGGTGDAFGEAVSLDGNIVAIAAPRQSSNSGAVYVYHLDSTPVVETWQETKVATGSAGSYFGLVASIHDGLLLIGSPGESAMAGAAHLYRYVPSDGSWDFDATYTAFDGAAGDAYGSYVSLYSNFIAIGSRWHSDIETEQGAVYIDQVR